jgi:hypothetical protein
VDEMWGCPQCHSINPAFVSSCYKCNSVRGAAPMVVRALLIGIDLGRGRDLHGAVGSRLLELAP